MAKLGLFLRSKPPLLLGILMQPAHSLLPFSSLKDASRYSVKFWKKSIKVALDKKIHNTRNVPLESHLKCVGNETWCVN